MAAAISATQARNPITLRAIRVVINRCPIVDTPYRAAPALPDGALHIRSPSSAQAGRVSWRSRDLITKVGFYHRSEVLCVTAILPSNVRFGSKAVLPPVTAQIAPFRNRDPSTKTSETSLEYQGRSHVEIGSIQSRR